MIGIPTPILQDLRRTLLECDEFFAANASLRDLFSDGRIYPFRIGLPERDSVNGRVEATIAHLANKYRTDGQNALVLFLHVLSDQLDPSDRRHAALQRLTHQLPSQATPHDEPHTTSATWDTAAVRQLLNAALDDQTLTALVFDHFRPVYDQYSDGLTRSHKIQLLIDYCTRQDKFESLLAQMKRLNAAKYDQHQPYLKRDT